MPAATWLLIFWTVTLAAWLFVHVVASAIVVRSIALEARWRFLGLVPPLTVWAAWRAGAKVTAVVWSMLAVLYVVLRAMD